MKRLWHRIAYLVLLAGTGPAIAAQIEPPPLEAYGDLPAVEDMAISPSGERLAIVSRIKNERRLVVLDAERRMLASSTLGDSKTRGIDWAGEDLVILYNSATQSLGPLFTADKYELAGALIVPLDGEKPRLVFDKSRKLGNTIFGRHGLRYVNGNWFGYFGGIELRVDRTGVNFVHGRPALYQVDLKRNSAQQLAHAAGEGRSRDWLVDGNGRVGATIDISGADGDWKIENAWGDTLASGRDPTGNVGLVSFGRSGATLIYALKDDEGEQHLFEVPLRGGTPEEILADVGIERLYIDRTNSRLLGYLERGSKLKPVLFDPARQDAATKIFQAFPNSHLTLMDWTPDFGHLLVRTSGNGDSGTWFTVDMARLKADPVGNARPRIDPEHVGKISTVDYTASDGLEMDGILTLPPGREAKDLPVILLPHGGPHAHDSAIFDWWAQAFASRGYAVFQPNFRGSTNRNDAFREAAYGEWGRKMQTDISDGLAELVRRGIADPGRACIMGASYGGYAALAGVTLQNGIYRCAVAVAPVSDLDIFYDTNTRKSGSAMTWRSLREFLGEPSGYDAVSPRKHADRADAPILLIHGKDDVVVPFRHSNAMAGALKRAGKPHELVVLKDEDHWLSRAETRKRMLEEAMRFVKKHNPPD